MTDVTKQRVENKELENLGTHSAGIPDLMEGF